MSIMIVLSKRRQTSDWFLDRNPLIYLYRSCHERPVDCDIVYGAGAYMDSGALLSLGVIDSSVRIL